MVRCCVVLCCVVLCGVVWCALLCSAVVWCDLRIDRLCRHTARRPRDATCEVQGARVARVVE